MVTLAGEVLPRLSGFLAYGHKPGVGLAVLEHDSVGICYGHLVEQTVAALAIYEFFYIRRLDTFGL